MLAISTACHYMESASNKRIALITDSMSSMQSLQNPLINTKIKHECVQKLNHLARSNQVSLIWVPSHSGIDGNEKADELANFGSALEVEGPDPCPPITRSVISQITKEWAQIQSHEKWHYSQTGEASTIMISLMKKNIHTQLIKYTKPHISNLVNCITGHGPFRGHLKRMRLVDEPCCPYCGAGEDTNIHFLLNCPRFNITRNQTLGFHSKQTQDLTKDRINISNLSDSFESRTGSKSCHNPGP